MAFWGIEVKPGKPFTQKFDDFKGRLHVSLATLGFGTSTNKSVLQCNVGSKSPVYLCSLFPEKTECLQLNLEYEESDEVIFSVIGPRSIHLSGYFLHYGRSDYQNDDTESYGEDIANSESQKSEYDDEDNYEDSFINDTDPGVFRPSPISNEEDETFDEKKTRNKTRSCRRLRKLCQMSDSDDRECCQHNNVANPGIADSAVESLDEDDLPILSLCKSKTNEESTVNTKEVRDHKAMCENADKTEIDGDFAAEVKGNTDHAIENGQPIDNETTEQTSLPVFANGVCPGNIEEPMKLVRKEGQAFQDDLNSSNNIIKESIFEQNDATQDKLGSHSTSINIQSLSIKSIQHSSEVSTRVDSEPKKKRKKRSKRKSVGADGTDSSYVQLCVEAKQDEVKSDSAVNALCGKKLEVNTGAELLGDLSLPSANVSPEDNERPKKKKKNGLEHGEIIECDGTPDLKSDKTLWQLNFDQLKKLMKKKRSKPLENGVSLKSDLFISSNGEEKSSASKIGVKESSDDTKPLPTGLVIEELEAGKPNGKTATSGRKISVLYVCKLKESGELVDSTDDGTPYKFRLGAGQVIEGWDTGLNGMRVGEKRRITIPPSMGYGNEGDGKNIPPDSWLVYEVELVKVR